MWHDEMVTDMCTDESLSRCSGHIRCLLDDKLKIYGITVKDTRKRGTLKKEMDRCSI